MDGPRQRIVRRDEEPVLRVEEDFRKCLGRLKRHHRPGAGHMHLAIRRVHQLPVIGRPAKLGSHKVSPIRFVAPDEPRERIARIESAARSGRRYQGC